MNPALKLDLFIGIPSYGGNGGISSEHPDIREWMVDLMLRLKEEPRIGRVFTKTISDTPVTMVRNRFVREARAAKCHLLLMADSDQSPNKHKGESWFKPFWDAAFDEIYSHYGKGPLVVGAPYCGPPDGGENIYVFYWDNSGSRGDETSFRLEQYPRMVAAKMRGVQECAALPTGMILYDMRCFDLIEPPKMSRDEALNRFKEGRISKEEALAAMDEGFFHYEWKDAYADEKSSTEDVQNTRDISLAGQLKLGYNPVRCAWDSWVGHHKPWNVGKPIYYDQKDITATFRRAVQEANDHESGIIDIGNLWQNYHGPQKSIMVDVSPPPDTIHRTPASHLKVLHDFVQVHSKHDRNTYILEIGSWAGDSAAAMMDGAIEGNADYYITCVDNWKGCPDDHTGRLTEEEYEKVFQKFKKNLDSYRGWNCYRVDSDVFFERYATCKYDIIFIDGNHSSPQVDRDIENAKKCLRPGGHILCHDYHVQQFPDVTKACDELLPGGKVLFRDESGSIYHWQST